MCTEMELAHDYTFEITIPNVRDVAKGEVRYIMCCIFNSMNTEELLY